MNITYTINRNTWWDHLDKQFLYFTLNDINYRNGTIVKLNSEYMNKYYPNLFKCACFHYRKENSNEYVFYAISCGDYKDNKQCGWFSINKCDLPDAIDEIVRPFKVHVHKLIYNNHNTRCIMVRAWAIYLAILLFSLIFKGFYLIWIMVSFVFFTFRNEQLKPVICFEDIS